MCGKNFDFLLSWYTSPDILALIEQHYDPDCIERSERYYKENFTICGVFF